MVVVGTLAAAAIIAVVLLFFVFPPDISIYPTDGAEEINPEQSYLEISTSRWGASITAVDVTEVAIAPDGSRVDRGRVEGKLSEGRFVAGDGSNPLKTDAEYTVKVVATVKRLGLSGLRDEQVIETHTFTTITTPMPVLKADGIVVHYGEEAVIQWNIPISSFQYRMDGIGSTSRVSEDGRQAVITLAQFEQGKEYPLVITSAESANGMHLKQPVSTRIVTPPPLTVRTDPQDGATGVSVDTHPALVFSEPVSNPELVESIVTVEPQVSGSLQWTAPDRLEFVPAASWDHLQDVTISIKGGPSMLRGTSGGFLEGDVQGTFTTAPYKMIDVDISSQVLTIYEDGVKVNSFLCSTGIAGKNTPLGDYTVYAKIRKTDMRGEGYFVKDVPWVLVFKGDYTIHGNYWNSSFGYPSSHGCVGLPVKTAEYLYNWAPIGTPIHIHK